MGLSLFCDAYFIFKFAFSAVFWFSLKRLLNKHILISYCWSLYDNHPRQQYSYGYIFCKLSSVYQYVPNLLSVFHQTNARHGSLCSSDTFILKYWKTLLLCFSQRSFHLKMYKLSQSQSWSIFKWICKFDGRWDSLIQCCLKSLDSQRWWPIYS